MATVMVIAMPVVTVVMKTVQVVMVSGDVMIGL